MKRAVHLCSFSAGLDEMRRKHQASEVAVLRVLAQCKRFSVFEATANPTIARTMTNLQRKKMIEIDNKAVGYPWLNVTLTPKGQECADANPSGLIAKKPVWGDHDDD